MRQLVESERNNGIGAIHWCLKNQSPKFGLTLRMRFHIWRQDNKWSTLRLRQSECKELGFLSGERGKYYVYNDLVEICGYVIRTAANIRDNSAVGIKYFWFDPFVLDK